MDLRKVEVEAQAQVEERRVKHASILNRARSTSAWASTWTFRQATNLAPRESIPVYSPPLAP
jgi:hypothetical protein